ncbi:glycosyl-4,4'-diaponeurosporenoate acyltransferase precursor [Oceanobacillus picturae]|uniref:Glycosyl-4,4'-diaponeurosporenoate acyltransferase n=1 Tax=Oceanobacillus picturae TaxID=171693 RepID=A0A0U9HHG0_9BACI|nr:hypothetical protein [Oceanobacillus picturae]RIU90070.1 glycosyl-4,4'-diaponeurosporenoate acyltransferase [Oceanobacillus picturae]GAQ18332.1 glycosyl-4,4'-diaponeurosporenoate acyltransferase precursor [Oceanobacillus picturae]
MPFVELPVVWIVIIDIIAWAVIHMAISYLTLSMPDHWFEHDRLVCKIRPWEKGGRLWQRYFRVKSWKGLIPDGTVIMGAGYNKKQLHGRDTKSLINFIKESRRAELTHWLSILPAGFFFIWNPVWAGIIMILYAFSLNIPIIIAQRYNRGRLEPLVSLKKQGSS